MQAYIALLRGINVGAHKRIAMADLRALIEGLGYADVRTHLNSGNVVFASQVGANQDVASAIRAQIASGLGMDIPVVVRSGKEMQRIVAENPFPDRAEDHKTLHVAFLAETPDPQLVEALAGVEKGDDDYRVTGDNVYLSYPNKLTGASLTPDMLEKALRVAATLRKCRTVTALAGMAVP
jgi:uncharacterized protein (DUF1697 family)